MGFSFEIFFHVVDDVFKKPGGSHSNPFPNFARPNEDDAFRLEERFDITHLVQLL